ncbi:hypothetical protein [Jannaschia helgolandensis]|uniref:hypothetical protein n=1 Tax=Jannaschia helgolandensis TaxID=188906 RepID=UPI0030D921B9
MKYTDLSQHLHLLRKKQNGRQVGVAMRVHEVWDAVVASDLTSIDTLKLYTAELPRPFDGLFVRMASEDGSREMAVIYVHKHLDKHWKEFVVIKEMMHCFTPGTRYTISPKDAAQLAEAKSTQGGRYTPAVAADDGGILAAAEVILPSYTVERLMAAGQNLQQIAHHHGLHDEIVQQICRVEMLHQRKNGSL